MIGRFKTASEWETIELGKKFARILNPGDVVALYGELGVGKTQFIKGVCIGLDVTEPVTSPSFIILNRYKGKLTVYHFDFYRVNNLSEILDTGFEEFIYDDGVSLIEWANYVVDILPVYRYDVFMNFGELENERIIEIRRVSK
jgi:tRNA threonylcarbamoyladenosine biosynthesis protein TsaE